MTGDPTTGGRPAALGREGMVGMSTPGASTPRQPSRRLTGALIALLVVTGVVTTLVPAYLAGWRLSEGGSTVTIWVVDAVTSLTPLLAMGAAVVLAHQSMRRGWVATAVGALVTVALSVWAMLTVWGPDALALDAPLFLSDLAIAAPYVQYLVAGIALGAAALVHRARTRTRTRTRTRQHTTEPAPR